jgi:hypothetical protein
MSRYFDVRQDDALFETRLQEVNREMDTLLHKTSRTRHEMDRTAAEVHIGVPLHFHREVVNSGSSSAVLQSCAPQLDSFPRIPAGIPRDVGDPVGGALRDDLTRAVVSAELTQWLRMHLPTLVAPLVDTQVQRHLQQLRDAVADVQARQVEVEQSVKEATEQLRVCRRDMQASLAAVQNGVQRDISEHQRTTEGRVNVWKEELRRMKDDLRVAQDQRRREAERVDQRLDESLQRQQQHVQDTFTSLDHELQRWRQCMQRDTAKDAQALRMQHDALEGHVAELQGVLSSTADMAARCAAELQRVIEETVARSSEVRLCRRDVNRLEMLVQCCTLQTAAMKVSAAAVSASGPKDSKRTRTSDGVEQSQLPALQSVVVTLTEEVAHLNDKVQAVVTRMDRLDRQVRQLDVALARGAAAAMPRAPFFDNGRGVSEESLFNRSAASTCRPSNSQLSSIHAGRPGGFSSARQLPNTTSTVSHDDSTVSRGTAADPHSRLGRGNTVFLNSASQPIGITAGQPSLADSGSGEIAASPHRVEAVPMWPGPQLSAVYHPPTSHLSNSSLLFEDAAEEPQLMPIVTGDSYSAPSIMTGVVVASKGLVGGGRESLPSSSSPPPPQRRAPVRVIPVESSPVSAAGASRSNTSPTPPALSSAKSTPRFAHSNSNSNSNHPPRSSSTSDTSSDGNSNAASRSKELDASPSGFTLNRYGAGARSSGQALQQSGGNADGTSAAAGHPGEPSAIRTASASSPADSYVSDTPAAAPSPEDSYVSDTPAAASAATPATSKGRFDRYTPAPASNSEDELDNEVISRSALD